MLDRGGGLVTEERRYPRYCLNFIVSFIITRVRTATALVKRMTRPWNPMRRSFFLFVFTVSAVLGIQYQFRKSLFEVKQSSEHLKPVEEVVSRRDESGLQQKKGEWVPLINPESDKQVHPLNTLHMTCERLALPDELNLVKTIKHLIAKDYIKLRGTHNGVIFTLATLGTLEAIKVQIASLKENARNLVHSFIVFCAGNEMCRECLKIHPICVPDVHTEKLLNGKTGASSLAHGDGQVNKLYVDLIWRKPELVRLLFASGVGEVTVVDSDGAWFKEPPQDFGEFPLVSSEMPELSDYTVNEQRCRFAERYRDAPLILNSGTAHFRKNAQSLALLNDWIDSRVTREEGLCLEKEDVNRTAIMLDQDGLNLVACNKDKIYSNQVKGLSSNQVLLNSVHMFLRAYSEFSICNVWFFHSTNCGDNLTKHTCAEKNLQRMRDQCRSKGGAT